MAPKTIKKKSSPKKKSPRTVRSAGTTSRRRDLRSEDSNQVEAALRESEGQLRESKLRFRALAEQIGNVFWISDPPNRKLAYVSPTFADIWGRNPKDLYDRFETWLDAIHDDDRARVAKEFFGNVLAGTYDAEYRIVRPDGSIRWIRDRGKPLGIGNLVAGVAEDITKRKLAEAALRESEGRLQGMMDYSPNLIFMKDLEGRYIDANKQFERTFHLTRQDLIGKTDHDIFPPEQAAAFRTNDLEVLQAGRAIQFEETALHDDGLHTSIVWKFPLRRLDDTPYAICGIATDITERRQAESALGMVQARQRLLLKCTPVVIYSCKVTGDYGATFISENVVDQLGYRPEDFTDDPHFWVNHIHPDDQSRVLADLSRIFETDWHVHEYRFLRKDGTYCWLHDEVRVIRNEAGVPLELIGYQIDISARKEAQEALRESEERLSQAIHVAKLGIFDHDHRTETLYWSPMMREIYGVPTDEPASLDGYIQLIHPDDRGAIVAAVRQAHDPAGDGLYAVEHRLVRRDGTVRWVSFRSRTLFEGAGPTRRPVRTVGAMVDMTERKQAEAALREREQEFRLLADNVPAYFAYIDTEWRYRFVNKRYEALFDHPLHELAGQLVKDVVGEVNFRTIEPHLCEALAGREAIFCYPKVLSHGDVRWMNVHYTPDRDETGRIRGVLALMTDVTAQKQTEQVLQQNQQVLQGKREELQMLAEKLLTAQDSERQRIARDLHDDFSQRLAALVLDVTALQRQPPLLPELIGKALEPVRAELRQLSDDLHNLAYSLHPSLLRHVGFQAAIEDYIHKAIERTGLQITLKANNLPDVVPLDWSTCLFRVFQESLQNVVKHAKATEVVVRLSGSSKGIGLSVIDNGKGFDARDKSSHQRGLGLISMQERLRLLNGFLNVHARPADGTKVCAWIPRQEKKS